jgi:Ca2+-binding RTX toxin-like protein
MGRLGRRIGALAVLFSAQPALAAYTGGVEGAVLHLVGNKKSDALVLRLSAGVPTVLEVDVGGDGVPDLTFDRDTFTGIRVDAGAGNDSVTIDSTNGLFTDVEATVIDGQAGNDVLIGGPGEQVFFGGAGDDRIAGRQGNDTAFLGEGDDVFEWGPGEGNDVVEGQDGRDRLAFAGSAGSELFELLANGGRALLLRNIGAITMDLDDVEALELFALGGADSVTVGDLSGTDVDSVAVSLEPSLGGGGGGDAQPDAVIVATTAAADAIEIANDEGTVVITGLPWETRIEGGEVVSDHVALNGAGGDVVAISGTKQADLVSIAPNGAAARVVMDTLAVPVDLTGVLSLRVDGLGGADTITGALGLVPLIALEIHGGKGDDILTGGDGADTIFGDSGKDVVNPSRGDDLVFLGSGADRTSWLPGDGSDTIEGQGGKDALVVTASNANEIVEAAANGKRLRLTRDVGAITMDLDGVEQVGLAMLGGVDTLVVGQLGDTAVRGVDVDFGPGDDGQVDTVVVNGTAGVDRIKIAADPVAVLVARPGFAVAIRNAAPAMDRLTVNGLAGVDKITAAVEVLARIVLTVNPD